MAEPILIETRIRGGVWEGVLSASPQEAAPALEVMQGDQRLSGATLASLPARPGHWQVRVPIPLEQLSDGVQTFVLRLVGGAVLGHFSVTVGVDRGEDLRAELDLLRAELDLVKQALRRHIAETTPG